jgi:hypothetical protein
MVLLLNMQIFKSECPDKSFKLNYFIKVFDKNKTNPFRVSQSILF